MSNKYKVGRFAFLDMMKFKNLGKKRDSVINNATSYPSEHTDIIKDKSTHLHPITLDLVVDDIIERYDAKEFVFASKDYSPLPFFRAGQYLSIKTKIGSVYTSRPYSICSSPKMALEGKISIMVENYPAGFVAPYLYKNLMIGDSVITTSPIGSFYHEPLRDENTVVALAGGSGVTPFISMAYAIRDGIEDFNLILIYGSRTVDSIYFKEELEHITSSTNKVKVVHVLSDEKIDGYEYGFINSDIIKKYAPEKYSIFACGPANFYKFMKEDVKKLNLPSRLIHFEMEAVSRNFDSYPNYPIESKDKVYKAIIHQHGNIFEIEVRGDEPILISIERAGINCDSNCRSGVCGWCRTRVVEGKTYSPQQNDFRRKTDKELGFIHPCAAFALSDLELEIN